MTVEAAIFIFGLIITAVVGTATAFLVWGAFQHKGAKDESILDPASGEPDAPAPKRHRRRPLVASGGRGGGSSPRNGVG